MFITDFLPDIYCSSVLRFPQNHFNFYLFCLDVKQTACHITHIARILEA